MRGSRRCTRDPIVEVDLREWLPDRELRWAIAAEVDAAYHAMLEEPRALYPSWETMDEVRDRALGALRPYFEEARPVVAVAHEVLIHALTGEPRTGPCDLRRFAS